MSSQTLATRQEQIGDYMLSITTRDDGGSSTEVMAELTYRTIAAFIWIAGQLEQGVTTIDVDTVEARYSAETGYHFEEMFGDPRVTVWDSYRGNKNPNFHLNSSDTPQVAINMWLANNDAIVRAKAKFNQPYSQNAPPDAPASAQTNASTPHMVDSPETPKTPVSGVIAVNGKKAGKELPTGQAFSMKIVKVMSVMSRTGVQTFELYCAYGGKPGEYADLLVYGDNKFSIENGVVANLNALGLKPGSEIIGEWFVVGQVYESKGKKGLNLTRFEAVEAT